MRGRRYQACCYSLPLLLVPAQAASLHDLSTEKLLAQRFPQPAVSYLLVDIRSRDVVATRWSEPEKPIPLGSLVKPFTALAYGEGHDFRYPEVVCRGETSGCWLPAGHGRIGLSKAIAHSCNAYFLKLAAAVRNDDLDESVRRFGFAGPSQDQAAVRIGLGGGWQVAPIVMVRAYCELASRGSERGMDAVLAGMALSAREGTGKGIGVGAFAKTGTAPCSHRPRGPGDGFVVAIYPAESPRFALLVRVHGVPGAQAAVTGGAMLRAIREGR